MFVDIAEHYLPTHKLTFCYVIIQDMHSKLYIHVGEEGGLLCSIEQNWISMVVGKNIPEDLAFRNIEVYHVVL